MPIGSARSERISFAPVLTNKDATGWIWVSENSSSRQFVNRHGIRPLALAPPSFIALHRRRLSLSSCLTFPCFVAIVKKKKLTDWGKREERGEH